MEREIVHLLSNEYLVHLHKFCIECNICRTFVLYNVILRLMVLSNAKICVVFSETPCILLVVVYASKVALCLWHLYCQSAVCGLLHVYHPDDYLQSEFI